MANTEIKETVVTLTEAAQAAALRYLAEDSGSDLALRIGVNSGGCNGFEYVVATDTKKADDVVHPYEGFEVVVDTVSKQFIQGLLVDYENTIERAGFKFSNPQASASCGCGTSFDVS